MLKQAADGSWYDDGQPDLSWVDRPLIPDTPPTARITVTKQKPTEWVESVPESLRSPDTTAADIAAYRVAKGVKRTPEPVKDDREALKQFFGPNNPERPSYVMEPDLMESQGGMQLPEGLMQRDDGSFYYVDAPSQNVPVVRRPNILPIAATPEGFKFAMPKMLDIVGNVMGNVGGKLGGAVMAKPGEMVLGSGVVKKGVDTPITIYRGEYSGNKGGKFWSSDPEFARQFTQSGLESEVKKRTIKPSEIYKADHVYAGNPDEVDKVLAEAKAKGFKAVELNEGQGQPNSILFLSDTRNQVASAVGRALERPRPNAQGFYSTLERAVNNAKVDKADAQQWLGYLRNQPGVKSEELETVLRDMPTGMITKGQMQELVGQNKVSLNEKVLGGDKLKVYDEDLDKNARHMYNVGYDELTDAQKNHVKDETLARLSPTKYSEYQLPGGENYRELLVSLPVKTSPKAQEAFDLTKRMQDGEFNSLSDIERKALFKKRDDLLKAAKEEEGSIYKAPHFDEHGTNLLYHVRMNDRNIEGNKTLHLEELQSDWHQRGRDYGYKGEQKKLEPQFNKIEQKILDSNDEEIMGNPDLKQALQFAVNKKIITQDEAKLYDRYSKIEAGEKSGNQPPEAPFKKSWEELALKRMIRKAAEEGYDAISWTPGEAQAARYDLSKQVSKVILNNPVWHGENDIRGHLIATSKANGNDIISKPVSSFKEIEDLIGKEAAEKLVNKPSWMQGRDHILEGDGLKVGGEGMKSFYDKMIVDKINNIAKKYGGKVESKNIRSKDFKIEQSSNGWKIIDENGKILSVRQTKKQAEDWIRDSVEYYKSQPVHFLKLTPELKRKAMEEGFPLFSSTPILSPVTHNPFDNKEQKKYRLTPVQGNPFQ